MSRNTFVRNKHSIVVMFFQKIYRLKYLQVKRYYSWDRLQTNASRGNGGRDRVGGVHRGTCDAGLPAHSTRDGQQVHAGLFYSSLRFAGLKFA